MHITITGKWGRSGIIGLTLAGSLLTLLIPLYPVLDMDIDQLYSLRILEGGSPYEVGIAPRPLSALLMQLPLAWLDTAITAKVLGVVCVLSVSLLASQWVDGRWVPVIAAATAVSAPTRSLVHAGNLSLLTTTLMVWAWARRSELAVGIAGAFRLYPLIMARNWKPFAWFGALMVAGWLVVPDVPGMVESLLATPDEWVDLPTNASLVGVVGRWATIPALCLAAGVWVVSLRWDFDRAMCACVGVAMLAPTLVWPGYHLILVPAIASLGAWWLAPLWFIPGAWPMTVCSAAVLGLAAWKTPHTAIRGLPSGHLARLNIRMAGRTDLDRHPN